MVQKWCASACSIYLEQIANANLKADFAEVYQNTIHERFEDMDKDELIRRLIWLQLKDTIDAYQDAEDLNAGYDNAAERGSGGGSEWHGTVRLFINVGTKDGITTNDKLLPFITETTDIEAKLIQRITVREMSSFFNVTASAAEFISTALSQRKLKGRRFA